MKGNKTTSKLLEQRGKTYGDPVPNLSTAHMLKELYRAATGAFRTAITSYQAMSAQEVGAHDEAMEMALLKVARIATAKEHHADNYDDLIGYVTIAKNIAMKGKK